MLQALRDNEQLLKAHELRKQPEVLVELLVQVSTYCTLLHNDLEACSCSSLGCSSKCCTEES